MRNKWAWRKRRERSAGAPADWEASGPSRPARCIPSRVWPPESRRTPCVHHHPRKERISYALLAKPQTSISFVERIAQPDIACQILLSPFTIPNYAIIPVVLLPPADTQPQAVPFHELAWLEIQVREFILMVPDGYASTNRQHFERSFEMLPIGWAILKRELTIMIINVDDLDGILGPENEYRPIFLVYSKTPKAKISWLK